MQAIIEGAAPTNTFVLRETWRRYAKTRQRQQRDELVLAYAPIVKYVAGGLAARMPAHVELADLISYGLGGLVKAVEGFDPVHGSSFESYARLRIRGTIIDELRSQDWVPRAVRDEARAIGHATEALTIRLQRVPTEAELAAELNLDATELDAALVRVADGWLVALDEPMGPGGGEAAPATLMDTLPDTDESDPAACLDAAELVDRIAALIAQLPEQEQLVLGLRYQQDLMLSEIGEVMSLTESRISQIHKSALKRMGTMLPDDVELPRAESIHDSSVMCQSAQSPRRELALAGAR